jgi:O-antigen biosynthesis protein
VQSGLDYLVASATAALADVPERSSLASAKRLPGYGADAAADVTTYRLWMEARAPRRAAERQRAVERLALQADPPTVSIAVPVFRPDVRLLEQCLRSVREQTYSRWDLVFCLDGPASGAVTEVLRSAAGEDPRIRVVQLEENLGIAAATNAAAEATTGEFLGFLDQDDAIEVGALADVALYIVDHPDADLLYTDQDKVDEDGNRWEPYFKPDWCPDLLLSNMYLGHLMVIRRRLFDDLGGLRASYDGSQDYDLALRATELAREVGHLPTVLYHWRAGAGSTASEYDAKPTADDAARRALQDALRRRGEDGRVEAGLWEGTFRVRREIRGEPLVRMIIPFHDGADMLQRCVDSLETTAGYDRWEAVLVDNRSWEPETRAVVRRLADHPKIRLSFFDGQFNWSAINNQAAREFPADHYLFMNSDIEGRQPGWLAAMLEHAQRPEVGAVGARLLYPEGMVQHAGVVMGLGGGVAWHAFCFCPEDHPGYFAHAKLIRNYTGVTGACMMVRHEVFEAMGGFDEELDIAYNDVDFCLRLREAGLLVVYTPFAELVHYEGATRGKAAYEHAETAMMMRRWGHIVRRDPYFNPNLNPLRSECQLAVDNNEEVDLWAHLE